MLEPLQKTSAVAPLDARRLRMLLEAVVDYAIYMLDADGHVSSWNAGAQRIKGYTPEEVIGRHFSAFFTPEDLAGGKPARALDTARRTGRWQDEAWRVRKDGTQFWALVVLDAIVENGAVVGFAKVTRDMTERWQAQHALEQAREQLFQSQKLEAVGQLTGGVAHDFNNLLTVVRGSIELAAPHAAGNPTLLRLHRAVLAATERGETLTRQLLSFARRQWLSPERTDTGVLLRQILALLEHSLRGDIVVARDLAPDLPGVEVDPGELELAILNIGLNARDAMPEGGRLTVTARLVSMHDHALELEGDYIAVAIADIGTGIAPELVARVVEPFYTTKEVGKGSGLGLSQAYGFARQSGGNLVVASILGEGTQVTLYLPVMPGGIQAPPHVAP